MWCVVEWINIAKPSYDCAVLLAQNKQHHDFNLHVFAVSSPYSLLRLSLSIYTGIAPGGSGGPWPPHFLWPVTPTFSLCHRRSWSLIPVYSNLLTRNWTAFIATSVANSFFLPYSRPRCFCSLNSVQFMWVHKSVSRQLVGVAKNFARVPFL